MSTDNNENKDTLTPQLMEIFNELNRLLNWYENSAKLIISIPLFINAGAVIALTAFFSNCEKPPFDIKLASIFFILGTIFGIFTLIFEYLTAFFGVTTYESHIFNVANRDKYLQELLSRYDAYNTGRHARTMTTIKIRMANGSVGLSFVSWEYFL